MSVIRKLVNGNLTRIVNETPEYKGDVIILIHPYNHLVVSSNKKEYAIDYDCNLSRMLADDPRTIITLEREGNLTETVKRHTGFEPKGERYFVETAKQSSYPLMGWEQLSSFIRRFSPDRIFICGCFLTENGHSACVGEGFKNLCEHFSEVEFIYECCLSPP